MAITKEYATGTIVAIQARATISAGNPSLLEYSWYRNGVLQTTTQTSGTATLLTTTAGTYYVVVSHPNAASVTSETFTLTLRPPRAILRLIYQTGGFQNINSSTGEFTSFQVVDWNIAENQYEFGVGTPESQRFGTPASGWWRIFAKEQNLSLDITLRGSNGQGSSTTEGKGGVGTLRRTFEQGQLYSIRIGDRRTGTGDDTQTNGPNGGRTFSGSGGFGGGQTYLKRGGTLIAVCGGGGGNSSGGNKGGDGGGLNVAGEPGQGNSRSGGRVVNPGDQFTFPGYPGNYGVRIMTRCGLDPRTGGLSCGIERDASDNQNNGGFADNNGGAGGSGVEGGYGGRSSSEAGSGGSGWASGAVTILSSQLGGNFDNHNGSVRIRQTGFVNYIASWYHTTGVRQGLTPTFQLTNTGNFDLQVIPQNVGFVTGEGGVDDKHYYVVFPESFENTNYTIDFTFVSRLIAAGIVLNSVDFVPTIFDKQVGSFRVKMYNPLDGGSPHVREAAFTVYPG